METSKTNPGSSYLLQKRTILIIILSLSVCAFFLFARDIPSRIVNGSRGRIAINALDEVRRPFLTIHRAESSLLRDGHSKTIHDSFEHGINNGLRLIAGFKTVSAYNRGLLECVEKLSSTFEEWINTERALFDLLAENSSTSIGLMSNVGDYHIIVKSSIYFTLVMDLLGDAEIPIHKDINDGSKAVTEIIITCGILLAGLIGLVFFLQWFKNKKFRELFIINKQTEERITSMANILEESLNEIYIFDSKTLRFLKVNKGARLNLGYSMEELSGLTPIDLKPGFTSEFFEELVGPLRTGKKEKIEFTTVHRRKDGSLYDAEVHLQLSIFESVPVFVAIVLDITVRKQAGEEISKLSQALKESPSIFMITDTKGDIEFVNPRFTQLTGYTAEEVIGQTPRFLKSDETTPEEYKRLWETITTGGRWKGELYNKKKNGELYWESASISSMINSDGVITNFIKVAEDITEHKRSEEKIKKLNETLEQRVFERTEELEQVNSEIKKSEGRFRELAETIPEVFWVTSPDFSKIIYVSPAYEIIWGRTCKSLYERPRSWMESISPDDRDRVTSAIKNSVQSKSDFVEEYRIIRPDGSKRWILDRAFSIKEQSGSVNYIIGIAQDITSQKQSEKDLRKKNSYLKLLQVAAVAANEAEDIKDAFLPILEQICCYTGWEIGHAYVISQNNPDLLKPTEVWCVEEEKQFATFCSITKKTDFARGVGLPGRVLTSCKPHWIIDVTKDNNFLRKQIALDLNIRSGIAFPVMVGSGVVAVLEFFTTREVEPDQQFMEIMADVGTQLGRVVERKQAEVSIKGLAKFPSENPNPVLRISNDGRILYNNQASLVLLDFWGSQTTKMLPDNYLKMISDILHSALSDVVEVECNNSVFSLMFAPVIEEGYINVYGLDITERKQVEKALLQSEKMKAMGIMTAGVAHEFNNILAVISCNAQLLEETNRKNKELSKSLRTICRMADDGAEIVDRMYDFTNVNKDTSRYVNVDLHDLIKQVIGFTMPRWKEMAQADGIKYQIVRKGVKALPSVLGNPSELREVILNIINNALDAMPEGGTITVSTRCVRSDEFGVESKKVKVSKLRTYHSELKSDFLKITFADTGKGMSEEVKKLIFDPFFTTRSPHGTGLGMSVSYGIIKRHGGEVNVKSEPGKGAEIELILPVAGKSIPDVITTRQIGKLKVDGLNILVVDDKEEICESLCKLFVEEGQKVCSVNSGEEAIALLKKNSYDLLICDLVMPDVNGRDIVNAIKTMNNRPKVGLITGWRYKIEDAEKEGLEVDFIVKKPFNLSNLRRDINSLWI